MSQRFLQLPATVWYGSFQIIGYIVASTLFAMLDDRQLAGSIAGRLFHVEAWIGLATGRLLLLAATALVRCSEAGYRRLRWLVLVMLLRVLVGCFGLQPLMVLLREQADMFGVAVGDSPCCAQFDMLHGISSVLYPVQSLLGLALIWKAAGVRQAARSLRKKIGWKAGRFLHGPSSRLRTALSSSGWFDVAWHA